jgi:hypothetical protein
MQMKVTPTLTEHSERPVGAPKEFMASIVQLLASCCDFYLTPVYKTLWKLDLNGLRYSGSIFNVVQLLCGV